MFIVFTIGTRGLYFNDPRCTRVEQWDCCFNFKLVHGSRQPMIFGVKLDSIITWIRKLSIIHFGVPEGDVVFEVDSELNNRLVRQISPLSPTQLLFGKPLLTLVRILTKEDG